jgi:hypothetical protein
VQTKTQAWVGKLVIGEALLLVYEYLLRYGCKNSPILTSGKSRLRILNSLLKCRTQVYYINQGMLDKATISKLTKTP